MKVKICGMTHPEDALHAAKSGADFIGILFSERSKRKVSLPLAKEITKAAKENGAIPVGVFVDESVSQILSICELTGLDTLQLHGEESKAALPSLQSLYNIIYAIPVGNEGCKIPYIKIPPSILPLFDSFLGGSGQPFNWDNFTPPEREWILAGGLTVDNLKQAIELLKPYGVDVSGGVEYNNSIRKDPAKVKEFIRITKSVGGIR